MKLTQEDIKYLEENHPDNVPIEVACKLINRDCEKSKRVDKDSLRVSIKKNACPFGWGIPSPNGNIWRFRIETHKFIQYFT